MAGEQTPTQWEWLGGEDGTLEPVKTTKPPAPESKCSVGAQVAVKGDVVAEKQA